MSGAPSRTPQGAGQLSVPGEASFAGAFGSKSCSRGPLLRLLSPADDGGEEKACWEENDFMELLRESVTPPRSEGCWKGAQAKHCQ